MRQSIEFWLNGERVSASGAAARRTVLAWLREERRLTGTKEGCAEGDCGACTAALAERRPDGSIALAPVATCVLFLGALDGKSLTTVEGLGGRHPAQRAMVECHGSQCGFCTPGFVMALYAHYHDARLDARDALAGNLCRCTGYAPILAAAARMREDAAAPAPFAPGPAPQGSLRAEGFSAPRSLEELIATIGPATTLLGGGTDLGLAVTKALRGFEHLVYLGNVPELKTVRDTPGALELGGAVTLAEALPALARLHPDLGELFRRFGGAQVRACATLAGNLANASPIGDAAPPLLALGATLVLQAGSATRSVALDEFFTGYRASVLRPGEFIRAVRIPKPAPAARFAVYKVSKRFDQDISALCGAFLVEDARARFAFGGMAATPVRARRAEAAWARGPAAAAAALGEDFAPLSDHRGSAWYRLTAAQGLLAKFAAGVGPRALLELAP